MTIRALTPLLVAGLATLLATVQDPGWKLSAPRPVDGEAEVGIDGWKALDCAGCHREVAEEWASTLHAFAWVDPFYREELADRRRQESCHGCHIPQPVHLTGLDEKPVPREEALDFGVTCASCHRGPDGTVLGPRGTPTDAHTSVQADSFVGAGTNALCSTCHDTFVGPVIGVAEDFGASELAAGGATCVGCHMAEVERRWANPPEGKPGEPSPVRKGRSHALQTPRDPTFLRRALTLSAGDEAGVPELRIENAAGHRVPGLIGRALAISYEVADKGGKVLASDEFLIDTEQPLKPGEPWAIELPRGGTVVFVKGEAIDPRTFEKVPFLDERLEVER